jgi:hypothetical protein
VANDKTLNPTHVSLYMSLFQFWNCNRFKNPISISRDEVMRISKISSKATYHKCLKNLHALGYINYEPSHNPFKGSHVYLLNFSDELKPMLKKDRNLSSNSEPVYGLVTKQVIDKSYTSSETGTEQALVSYINNTNIPNILNNLNVSNLDEQAKKNENEGIIFKNGTDEKEKKLREKKKSFSDSPTQSRNQNNGGKDLTTTIEEVKSYFLNQNFPELEANKFFNYFSSVGWLVGGKTPMVDWQAAAQNWILNAPNFKHNTDTTPIDRAKHLNIGIDKDYAEPL